MPMMLPMATKAPALASGTPASTSTGSTNLPVVIAAAVDDPVSMPGAMTSSIEANASGNGRPPRLCVILAEISSRMPADSRAAMNTIADTMISSTSK
ncbi:MAG: hypothetical protein BWY85_01331 [Firmicutes bacterium ADurb.Bin506]|nr:MAG: hypothetical protein BWY85_01331 [Firmicutes bacterium ADurb.Bin506]